MPLLLFSICRATFYRLKLLCADVSARRLRKHKVAKLELLQLADHCKCKRTQKKKIFKKIFFSGKRAHHCAIRQYGHRCAVHGPGVHCFACARPLTMRLASRKTTTATLAWKFSFACARPVGCIARRCVADRPLDRRHLLGANCAAERLFLSHHQCGASVRCHSRLRTVDMVDSYDASTGEQNAMQDHIRSRLAIMRSTADKLAKLKVRPARLVALVVDARLLAA